MSIDHSHKPEASKAADQLLLLSAEDPALIAREAMSVDVTTQETHQLPEVGHSRTYAAMAINKFKDECERDKRIDYLKGIIQDPRPGNAAYTGMLQRQIVKAEKQRDRARVRAELHFYTAVGLHAAIRESDGLEEVVLTATDAEAKGPRERFKAFRDLYSGPQNAKRRNKALNGEEEIVIPEPELSKPEASVSSKTLFAVDSLPKAEKVRAARRPRLPRVNGQPFDIMAVESPELVVNGLNNVISALAAISAENSLIPFDPRTHSQRAIKAEDMEEFVKNAEASKQRRLQELENTIHFSLLAAAGNQALIASGVIPPELIGETPHETALNMRQRYGIQDVDAKRLNLPKRSATINALKRVVDYHKQFKAHPVRP